MEIQDRAERLHILFFHRWVGVHYGGTEAHIRGLVKHLSLRGHVVEVLTQRGLCVGELLVPVHTVNPLRNESPYSYADARVYFYTAFFMIKSFFRLLAMWCSGKRFDVISVHFATEAVVAKAFSLITGTPIVFVLEGYTRLEGRVAKIADACTTLSEHDRHLYLENHGLQAVLAFVGVDQRFSGAARTWAPDLGESQTVNLLCVCRLEPRKDLGTLLRALHRLGQGPTKFHCSIVGTGIAERELHELRRELGLERQVTFVGAVEDELLPTLYSQADLFVMTSIYEGFGIVYIEAMATGLPILTTRAGAAPEVVGEAGIVTEVGDVTAFASALERLIREPSRLSKMSTIAIERASQFRWEAVVVNYETVYRDVVMRLSARRELP